MLQETAELWACAQLAQLGPKRIFVEEPSSPAPCTLVSACPFQGHCPVTCWQLFHIACSREVSAWLPLTVVPPTQ